MKLPFHKTGKINYAAGHLRPEEMNKTEADYADHLKLLQLAGDIAWWKFHSVNLRLPGGVFYAPDFMVVAADGILEIHEVKGNHWTDDARAKIKIAAGIFPFRFFAIQKQRKMNGGGWIIETF